MSSQTNNKFMNILPITVIIFTVMLIACFTYQVVKSSVARNMNYNSSHASVSANLAIYAAEKKAII